MRSTRFAFPLILALLLSAAWNLIYVLSIRAVIADPSASRGPAGPPDFGALVYSNHPERLRALGLIKVVKHQTEILQTDNEAYQIFMAVTRTAKIKGALAEVGVYKGGSARLICKAKGNKPLYLFDTFSGIPSVGEIDQGISKGQFAASLEQVKKSLSDCEQTYFYKGWFPASADGRVRNTTFSFVHLDVDTYESTMNSLRFFYPRVARGGVILSHDYISVAGVRKAFDEFFKDKPEPIIELSGTQCLIVKT